MSIELGHHNLTFLIWILNRFYMWDDDEKTLASGMTSRIKHWNMICHVCLSPSVSVSVCLEQTNSHQRGVKQTKPFTEWKQRSPFRKGPGTTQFVCRVLLAWASCAPPNAGISRNPMLCGWSESSAIQTSSNGVWASIATHCKLAT